MAAIKEPKSIFESGEVMGFYAVIDMCYWQLDELKKEMDSDVPKYGIERMIDICTGAEYDRTTKYVDSYIGIYEVLLEHQDKVNVDSSNSKKALKKFNEFKVSRKSKEQTIKDFKRSEKS